MRTATLQIVSAFKFDNQNGNKFVNASLSPSANKAFKGPLKLNDLKKPLINFISLIQYSIKLSMIYAKVEHIHLK